MTAVVLVVVGLWVAVGQAADPGTYEAGGRGAGGDGGDQPTDLLGISVVDTPAPLMAVIGGGGDRRASFMDVPTDVTLVVPGQGETSADDLSTQPADTVQIGLSNMLGGWIDHVAVTDPEGIASAVDRAGGITVNVFGSYDLGGKIVGPGEAELTGAEAAALLEIKNPDVADRWRGVLGGLLAAGWSFAPANVQETDDLAGVNDVLASSKRANAIDLPTEELSLGVVIPLYEELDALVSSAFGVAPPVPTIVENGSGVPGVGEPVARRILPLGFRVVLSRNAESFDHEVTQIVAVQRSHVDEAERVRRALGAGRVRLTRVPSGIGDIVIVVGKDFQA